MLKNAVDKLETWGKRLHDKPVWLLPITIWPLILIYIALILIWVWLKVSKPLRRNAHE